MPPKEFPLSTSGVDRVRDDAAQHSLDDLKSLEASSLVGFPSGIAAKTATWIPTVPRWTVWALVALSVLSLLLSPLEATVDRIVDVAPWVALALFVSEAFFLGGLAVMASLVGVRIGWNPFQWSERFEATVSDVTASPAFWIAFATNTLGGIGTALVLFVGIVVGLPVQAWGLLVLPLLDLALTAAVRIAILGRIQNEQGRLA